MKNYFVTAALVTALLGTAAQAQMGGGSAPSSSSSKPKSQPSGDGEHVSKALAAPLMAAQKLQQSGDYQGALAQVKIAQALPDQTDYDTFEINQFLAAVDIALKDYAGAGAAMEAAADSPYAAQMTDQAAKKSLLHNALLLAGQSQHWQKVISYATQLDAVQGQDDVTYAVTAQAYYFTKDSANAKTYAQKSIDAAKVAGKQPDEAVMQIVMGSQASTDQAAAEATLEQIVLTYNRPKDWDEVVQVSLGAKGMSTADGLNMYRLLYIQGPMLTADDYTYLANIAEAEHNSVEARNALQAGVAAGKITSNATLAKAHGEAAGDEKIIAQAIAAASKSKRGEDSMSIAQDLWGYGRYADVETFAMQAKAKGGLKDPGEANVLIGMAQIAQGKYDQGIATLGQVVGTPGRMRTAHLWTLYAQTKQKGSASVPAPAH